jgi:hypothetical protein
MMNGVELVVQHSDENGAQKCHTYVGLRLSSPVLIVLADYSSADSRGNQLDLWRSIESEITGPFGAQEVTPPCGGSPGALGGCHARQDSACQKLLVLVGDDHSLPSPSATMLSNAWTGARVDHAILPVFPLSARTSVSGLLPVSARAANVDFWTHHPRESLPALFALAGLTVEQSRLFISYRQIDSAALAIQLFDALSHEGFDVFLDHFRIPPGVNFQARLTQELGDKSMVLLLESQHLGDSQWVAHEINVAKSCGLGLLGLLLPNGRRQPSLDEGNRQEVSHDDFVDKRFTSNAILEPDALDRVVASVKTQHDRALVARRRMLELSFEGALARERCGNVRRLGNGAFDVRVAGKDYLVWLTTRPPDMPDFHRAHGAVAVPAIGVIIGLSRLMEPARTTRTAWLAGLCQFKLADEGQLSQVARDIARGSL